MSMRMQADPNRSGDLGSGHERDACSSPMTRPARNPSEAFSISADGKTLFRAVTLRNGRTVTSSCSIGERASSERCSHERLAELWDQAFLRATTRPPFPAGKGIVRFVDLFSGCGLMSLGVSEACRAIGKRAVPVLAVDINEKAAAVYAANFPAATEGGVQIKRVDELLDGKLGTPPTRVEVKLRRRLGAIDILVGGPPCQGHSSLNNHTRGDDPKNRLYARMARFAEVVSPTHIVIENVPQVLRDKGGVVARTAKWLRGLGYAVDDGIIESDSLGVPQRRRRHVLIASLKGSVSVSDVIGAHRHPPRSVAWAIGDLLDVTMDRLEHRSSRPTAESRRRIDFLFDNDLYDLPDSERPACHRLKEHSYRSVYGRMHWNSPAQTVTSGFSSMGQGRNVHPLRRRTITPREAARLQFIPDFFSFDGVIARTQLAEMIANAVPPKIVYAVALELLR